MNTKTDSNRQPERTLFGRIAPSLAFVLAICLLVVFCYDAGFSGLPPTEKRYAAAKAGISALRQDVRKNMQREPWENLAAEFRSIYDGDPAWPNRPAALFRAAESLEELATRSCSRADARKAINYYETLALRHASSRLADDALFRAARMRAAALRDDSGALALLARIKKQYPRGDMIEEAVALERAIRASSKGKTASEALKTIQKSPAEAREDLPASRQRQFSGDLPLQFKAAKSRMASLRKDKIKSCWRQPWQTLQAEFMRIHKAGKKNLGPEALYQAAVCQQAIANCSRLSQDAKKAVEFFERVAREYPRHNLSDDALFHAARLQYGIRNGQKHARSLLERQLALYPKGDKAQDARKLLASWNGAESKLARLPVNTLASKKADIPELQVLSWDSVNRNSVEIVLEMSAPATYATRLEKAAKNRPARLYVDLANAEVVKDIKKGVTVQGSLLKAVRVHDRPAGGATLQFDFRDVSRFDARNDSDPCRIVLNVAAGKTPLPRKEPQPALQAQASAPDKLHARQVANMASQLGLTVHRVFIDAGHGGKDPGTSHNRILERTVSLEVALAVGRLLEANGLEVIYSRTRDRTVPLSERARLANAARADLFVSIHINANENPAVNGLETYYLNLASNPQAARVAMLENAASDRHLGDMQTMLADVMLHAKTDESRRLAADIQRVAMFRLKKREFSTRNNGVKSAPFHVLLGAKMPAVLVELGYCTNPAEAKNLANPKYRHALAEGLAEGIMAYKERLLKNRTAQNSLTDRQPGAM